MPDRPQIRKGNVSELPLQASKWLDLQLLIDPSEMEDLLFALGDFDIYKVGSIYKVDEGEVFKEEFLGIYSSYVDHLKNGKIPDEKLFRPYFSSIFTKFPEDHLYQILVGNDRRILRIEKPALQLQVNQVTYSITDNKFRAGVFGKNGILWGIHFSYPQLFLESKTKDVFKIASNPEKFPNTILYKNLQHWVRKKTIPTPFLVNGQKINATMRLGKNCLSWINDHPQLVANNIRVFNRLMDLLSDSDKDVL